MKVSKNWGGTLKNHLLWENHMSICWEPLLYRIRYQISELHPYVPWKSNITIAGAQQVPGRNRFACRNCLWAGWRWDEARSKGKTRWHEKNWHEWLEWMKWIKWNDNYLMIDGWDDDGHADHDNPPWLGSLLTKFPLIRISIWYYPNDPVTIPFPIIAEYQLPLF